MDSTLEVAEAMTTTTEMVSAPYVLNFKIVIIISVPLGWVKVNQ